MSAFDESVRRLQLSRGVLDGYVVDVRTVITLMARLERNIDYVKGLKITLGQKDTGEPEVWLSVLLASTAAKAEGDDEPLNISHPCGPPPFPPCP